MLDLNVRLGFPFDAITHAAFLQHLLGRSTVDLLGTSTNTMIGNRFVAENNINSCFSLVEITTY